MGVLARFAYRLGSEGSALGPAAGFSLGATFERRYALVGQRLGLGLAVDLFHDHFMMGVQGSEVVSPGVEQPYDAQRVVTETSFALLQTVGTEAGPARFWVAGGAGVTVGYLSSPERDLRPGSTTAVQALGRGAVGIDIAVRPRTAVGIRSDLTHLFGRPTFTTTAGQTYSPFGDLFDVGLGLLYHF
jgi:hypothetical protein